MTYGYSLYDIRLQPLWHTVAASMTYGYSLYDQVSGIPTFVLGATTVLPSAFTSEGSVTVCHRGCNRMS